MDDDDDITPQKRSPLAEQVARLRSATVSAAGRRERLPQPLFWSLFRSELEEIKRRKARARAVSTVLSGDSSE